MFVFVVRTSKYFGSCRILPYLAVSCCILLYRTVSAVSCCILPYPAVSCVSCRILPYPYLAVSYRIEYAYQGNPIGLAESTKRNSHREQDAEPTHRNDEQQTHKDQGYNENDRIVTRFAHNFKSIEIRD